MLGDNAFHTCFAKQRAFEAREDSLANNILKVVDCLLAEEQSKATSDQSSILLTKDSSSQQTMLMQGSSVDNSASRFVYDDGYFIGGDSTRHSTTENIHTIYH